jgi:tetratricopeptide (TPR) repeat protein
LVATTILAPKNLTAGFSVHSITPWTYLKSQFAVMLYYLRLAIWPDSLCLDYDWKRAETLGEILPYALVVLALVGVTLWALWHRKAISFLGVWFFVILSLTSSIMPFEDLIFEHRMYLSLAAVVALVVLSAYDLGKRSLERFSARAQEPAQTGRLAALTAATLIVTMLALLTVRRNVDYKSHIVMWNDVVKKYPTSARAQNNIGFVLAEQGLTEEALAYFLRACQYKPNYAEAESNVGRALLLQGKPEEARPYLLEALRINPQLSSANFNMGQYLALRGELDESLEHFYQALRTDPYHAQSYSEIGMIFERQRKLGEALEAYDRALQLDPQEVDALGHQAMILVSLTDPELRNIDRALRQAEQAVRLTQGQQPYFLYVLAVSYAESGRLAEAVESAQRAKALALAMGNKEFAEVCETRLKVYRQGRPS